MFPCGFFFHVLTLLLACIFSLIFFGRTEDLVLPTFTVLSKKKKPSCRPGPAAGTEFGQFFGSTTINLSQVSPPAQQSGQFVES